MTISNNKRYELRSQVDKEYEYNKWITEMPYFTLPVNYEIKVIPPFGGAVSRFLVRDRQKHRAAVSVYLDCYDMLGYFGEPYWEMYPDVDGDVNRFPMSDVDSLLENIEKSIESQLGQIKKEMEENES